MSIVDLSIFGCLPEEKKNHLKGDITDDKKRK